MLTRRRFLGYSLAGMATAAAACRPSNLTSLTNIGEESPDNNLYLAGKTDLAQRKDLFLGYPLNMNRPPDAFFEWRNQLSKVGFGEFGFNNVGNPFGHSPIPSNSHDFERELILRFGKRYGFDADDIWGFLSHSGTDSNMHGMYMGRTILKGHHQVVPKCYFTREAHYSIQILGDLLGMTSVFVNTLPDGSMDAADLDLKLSENPDQPGLVVATIGTTFKGAIDHVDRINEVLEGYDCYLHLDAALFGGYLPYTAGADEVMHSANNYFKMPRYDSIAISCHKFFGFPSPAGLFITTQKSYEIFNEWYSKVHNPEYIGHVPGTITCSRDAVKPAEFYFFSSEASLQSQSVDAKLMLENSTFLMDQLYTHFPGLHPTRAGQLSNTIYFRNPSDRIIEKYSLATMQLQEDGKSRDFAHVVIMPHVTRDVLSEFLEDLDADNVTKYG